VRKRFVMALAVCVLGAFFVGLVRAAAQQAQPASTMNVEEILRGVRADLQASRADIIAKNLTLTSEQAAKFWPVYDKYQQEQSAIMDQQLKGIQQYSERFQALDDAGAMALIKAHLERDARMVALRVKWLPEFQKVLPTKLAVKLIQIDRRLSLAHQLEISSQIPLVY
jgi:Spy/CpxP family protein refolding chaperone